ncbi:MAG: STAS domain-containing protein [Eubacterium sp.]|nr:STAS domain-containing protein [Eubacterium sp.]
METEFKIKHISNSDKGMTLAIVGRIDATNFEDFLDRIHAEREKYAEGSLTLDADEMYYISSAGLRSILALVKEEPEMISITNLTPDLYEIFDDAGFTDIINITSKEES